MARNYGKVKTTRNYIKAVYGRDILSIGYCDAATLLRGENPWGYNCGVYGWNYDVYTVHGIAICTGYRGMPGRKANNVHEYERRARAIADDYSRPYEDRQAEIAALLDEFIAQA